MVKGHAWQRGACVVKGGMHGKGACVAGGMHGEGGMCGKGACMVGGMHGGGMHGRGHAWWGHSWQGDMHGRGGACVAGEMATAAGGMHPTGIRSCSKCISITILMWLSINIDFTE